MPLSLCSLKAESDLGDLSGLTWGDNIYDNNTQSKYINQLDIRMSPARCH